MSAPTATVRVSLVMLGGTARYRSDHPLFDPQTVEVYLGRDRFHDLGKPGYLDVTITVPADAAP